MSITDELREWVKSLYTPNSDQLKREAYRIADRIDAKHNDCLEAASSNGYYKARREFLCHLDEAASPEFIRLPVDADGEPIHIGDVMEWVRYEDDDPTIVRKVVGVGADVFFAWSDEQGRYAQYEAHAYRHHHAPTVEDVLREMCLEIDRRCERGSIDYDELFAEYAARLHEMLAGDAE